MIVAKFVDDFIVSGSSLATYHFFEALARRFILSQISKDNNLERLGYSIYKDDSGNGTLSMSDYLDKNEPKII